MQGQRLRTAKVSFPDRTVVDLKAFKRASEEGRISYRAPNRPGFCEMYIYNAPGVELAPLLMVLND